MGPKPKATNNKKDSKSRACKNSRSTSYLADDHNYQPFKVQLDKIGLQIRDIGGDGNCCFRALSDQMEGKENQHTEYRKQVCLYMRQKRDEFEPFIAALVADEEENNNDGKVLNKKSSKKLDAFENYIRNLELPGTYADNGCLVAFARLYQLNINIHQLDLPIWTISGLSTELSKKIKKFIPQRQINLAYHNMEHYSSIRLKGDITKTPTDINIENQAILLATEKSKITTNSKKSMSMASAVYYDDYENENDNSVHELNVDQIINITNFNDVNLITEKLRLNNNNVDLTIDELFNEMDLNEIEDTKIPLSSKKILSNTDKKREKKTRQMERKRQEFLEKNGLTDRNNKTTSNDDNNSQLNGENLISLMEIKSI